MTASRFFHLAASVAAFFFVLLCFVRPARAEGNCTIERAVGFSDSDVEAIEDVTCSELHKLTPERRDVFPTYKIRLSKLGGKIVYTLTGERNGARTERQLLLANVEEVIVAAPRLVESLCGPHSVAETQDVTNVVEGETRVAKQKPSTVHFHLGMIGVGAPGVSAQAGAHMAFEFGNETWSFLSDVRIAGRSAVVPMTIATLGIVAPDKDQELGFTSLNVGARYHLSAAEHAPFVGAGIGWDVITAKTDHEQKNSGLGGYGEIGMDFLRASRVGGALALRVDAPTFGVKGAKDVTTPAEIPGTRVTQKEGTKRYLPIIGASFSLRF